MQLGVIGAVPLIALLALLTRRIRLAAYAALAGGTIYLVAKLVKRIRAARPAPSPLGDAVAQVEHEASMGLLAAAAGVHARRCCWCGPLATAPACSSSSGWPAAT